MKSANLRQLFDSPYFFAVVIVIVTAAVYGQMLRHEFINFDDEQYVTAEPMVQAGLTAEGIRWALTDVSASNWFPLTRISHMIDCELFGVRPGPHLLVNLLFHLANTLLLLGLFYRMTGAAAASAFVAAVFALHPLHIESVAWVSERKDLLSTFFALIAMNAYAGYVKSGSDWKYFGVMLAFTAALMSKSMVVTIPCVLLLLDHWPFKRYGTVPLRRIVLEKAPLLALSAIISAITIFAQGRGGAMASTEHLPLATRLMHVPIAYVTYLENAFWPTGLAIFYPYPEHVSTAATVLCAALLIVVSVAAFVLVRRVPYLFVGWFWFVGMLVPVIGIVQVGNQALADRYTYLSLTGIAVIVAWGAKDLASRLRLGAPVARTLAYAACVAMAVLTAVQLGHWRDSETLFRHAIAVTEGNTKAHNNLGTALYADEKYAEAEAHFRAALEYAPGNIQARNNLGAALLATGKPAEALATFEEVLRVRPDDASVHLNAAVALLELGRYDEALRRARRALEVNPDYAPAQKFLEVYGGGR